MPGRVDEKIRCSFCGKTQDQVRKLIAGNNNVFICDECIDLCSEILEEELPEEEDSGAEGESGPAQPERSSRRRTAYCAAAPIARITWATFWWMQWETA